MEHRLTVGWSIGATRKCPQRTFTCALCYRTKNTMQGLRQHLIHQHKVPGNTIERMSGLIREDRPVYHHMCYNCCGWEEKDLFHRTASILVYCVLSYMKFLTVSFMCVLYIFLEFLILSIYMFAGLAYKKICIWLFIAVDYIRGRG